MSGKGAKNSQVKTVKKQDMLNRKKKRNIFWLPEDEVRFDW